MVDVPAFTCLSGFPARHHHARPVSMIASLSAFPHVPRAEHAGQVARIPGAGAWPPHSPLRRHPRQATPRLSPRDRPSPSCNRRGHRSTSPSYCRSMRPPIRAPRRPCAPDSSRAARRRTHDVRGHSARRGWRARRIRRGARSPAPRSSSDRWCATISRSSRRRISTCRGRSRSINPTTRTADPARLFTFSLAVESDARDDRAPHARRRRAERRRSSAPKRR